MPNSELLIPDAFADAVDSLQERISELEEHTNNLRRLEDTIERNNKLFEALLAASKDGIALTGPDASIIRVINSVLGYGATLASGASIYDLIYWEDRAAMRACYHQLLNEHVHQVCHDIRMLKPDGSVIWVEGTVTDLLDDPNVLAIVHNYRDITQRKMSEIHSLELAAVIQQAPFAFFSKSSEGVIQSWNSGAARSFGYTADEIIGQHISTLVPPANQAEELEMRMRVVRDGVPVGPLHAVRAHKNGTHLKVELTLTPMMKDGSVHSILHLSQTQTRSPV